MRGKKITLLDAIQNIELWLSNDNPDKELCCTVENAKEQLGSHFGISSRQALFVAVIFLATSCDSDSLFDERSVGFGALASMLKRPKSELFKLIDDFDNLIDMGILATDDEINKTRQNFSLPSYIADTIISNTPFKSLGARDTRIGLPELFRKQHNLIKDACRHNSIPIFRLIKHFEAKYSKFEVYYPFLKRINELDLTTEEKILFFEVCGSTSFDSGQVNINEYADLIYTNHRAKKKLYEALCSGSHTLIHEDLLDVEGAYINDMHASLTVSATKMYLEEEAEGYLAQKKRDKNIISADDIPAKELFFSGVSAEQLKQLEGSIDAGGYDKLKEELVAKGLSPGVTAILYGPPGTGKTESVMQMARRTGRGVIHVDISTLKSKWFGESEKIVKRIFTNYEMLAKREKLCPVLLFNEADAIFGRRQSGELHSTDQALNTMQNILLEELECFEGIMIATTNMVDNLDPAFERRFLFKIKLPRPSVEIKCKIWHCRLPLIPEEHFSRIASQWDFSGGEIDNVVRKATINEILRGEQPSVDIIEQLCKQEKLSDSIIPRIGFR